MTRAAPSRKTAKPPVKAVRKPLPANGFEPPETEDADDPDVTDDLADETGLDLTDASELDADNVPADEESDRVLRGPD